MPAIAKPAPILFALAALMATTLPARSADTARHRDINYLAEAMPANHDNLFHDMSEADFQKHLDQLNAQWPELDRQGAMLEISRLLAGLRDGHAFVDGILPPLGPEFDLLPVDFYQFSDGLYIRSADAAHARLAGAKVVQFEKLPTEEAFARAAALVTHDNDMTLLSRTPYYLQSLVVLAHIGAAKDPGEIVLTLEKEGVTERVTLKKMSGPAPKSPYGLVERKDWVDANPAPPVNRPLWQRDPEALISHSFDPETGIFYLQYNAFEEPEGHRLAADLAEVSAAMTGKDIRKFVLDIRRCRGGETPLVRTLAKWLMENPQINQKDRFFVVIGRRTFSAGQLLINALDQFSNAIFVGEPSGASPIFYANARANVRLEDKDITILLPTKYWQTTEQDDLRAWQAPDLAAALNAEDYRTGRDPALAAIKDFKGMPDLKAILVSDLQDDTKGLEAALRDYKAFKANPLYRYVNTEEILNDLGYDLLGLNRTEEAIALFAANASDYPASANAYDSLAEAYMRHGERQKAIENYQRSLELDPGNTNASEQIEKLQAAN